MRSPSESWVLALAAVALEKRHGIHELLGGLLNTQEEAETAQIWLREDCSVDSEEALAALLQHQDIPNESSDGAHRLAYLAGQRVYAARLATVCDWRRKHELWQATTAIALQVRNAFRSWAEFGEAYLLGELLVTGTYQPATERALFTLLSDNDGPWQLPWSALPQEPQVGLGFRLRIHCAHCGLNSPVHSFDEDQRCAYCSASLPLTRDVLTNMVRRDIARYRHAPPGATFNVSCFDDVRARYVFSITQPGCPNCELPLTAAQPLQEGYTVCRQCGESFSIRPLPEWLAPELPGMQWIVGETRGPFKNRRQTRETVVVLCDNCGLPLSQAETARVQQCAACHASTTVDAELWARLCPNDQPPRIIFHP